MSRPRTRPLVYRDCRACGQPFIYRFDRAARCPSCLAARRAALAESGDPDAVAVRVSRVHRCGGCGAKITTRKCRACEVRGLLCRTSG
jgi:hypothetical protein